MDIGRLSKSGQKLGKLVVQGLSSCALMEISGLVKYADQPDRAMRDFHLQSQYESAAIVVFHGVIKNTSGYDYAGTNDEWCNGCKYSQQFAAFIIENKLGDVKEGVEAENARYHPGHIIRVYTWTPDYKAIKQWYNDVGIKIS